MKKKNKKKTFRIFNEVSAALLGGKTGCSKECMINPLKASGTHLRGLDTESVGSKEVEKNRKTVDLSRQFDSPLM